MAIVASEIYSRNHPGKSSVGQCWDRRYLKSMVKFIPSFDRVLVSINRVSDYIIARTKQQIKGNSFCVLSVWAWVVARSVWLNSGTTAILQRLSLIPCQWLSALALIGAKRDRENSWVDRTIQCAVNFPVESIPLGSVWEIAKERHYRNICRKCAQGAQTVLFLLGLHIPK